MIVVFVVLAVLVLVGAAFVLTGRWDPGIRSAQRPGPPQFTTPVTAAEVRGARFRVGLRGYRMQDVDALLALVADELDRRRSVDEDGAPTAVVSPSVTGPVETTTPPAG